MRRLVVLGGLVVGLVLDILESLTVRLIRGLAGMPVVVHENSRTIPMRDRLPTVGAP